MQLAIAHQEDVLARALANESLRIEQHRLFVAVVSRLLIGKDRDRVITHGLGVAHRDIGMMMGK